ncbi:MAG: hypothetical protein Q8M99_11845 [Methylotenera sp.]|nr:hypothetical protein [Methylotenera sp.]
MFEVNATISGFSRIDFDKKKIRRALQIEGRAVQKLSRKLVSKRILDSVGDYPAKKTGRLMRSIKSKVSKSGFLVRIAPQKTAEMKDFYPAFLHYGSKKNNLAPRKNFMTDALDARRDVSRVAILNALEGALIPRN